MIRLTFFVSLQDQFIKGYEQAVLEIASSLNGFKHWEYTKNSENAIFISIWTPMRCLKSFEFWAIGSQLYAYYEKTQVNWCIFHLNTWLSLQNGFLCEKPSKWL